MKKISKKIAVVLGIISISCIFNTTVFAQVKKLKLGVDGLACPFCAYGLEKKLKSLEGIESLDISLKKGMAEIVFKEDNNVDLAKIKIMVKDAGYTLRSMMITASGTIRKEKDYLLFDIKGNQNKLYIFDERAQQEFKGEHPSIILNVELSKKFEALSENKTPIEITGAVHSHPDGSFGLSVEEHSVEENKE